MWDLLVRDASIIDGSGGAAYNGSIAIREGRITEIGSQVTGGAFQVIDGRGLTALPGFVDLHRHGDLVPFRAEQDGEELRQGITSFVSGNCGFSPAPSSSRSFGLLRDYGRPIMGEIPDSLAGRSFREYLEQVRLQSFCSNMGFLVGNGTLRIAVKGFQAGPFSAAETDRILGLLRESLEAGAFGLSMGLMYVPENFYSTQELVKLCREVERAGRLVTVHMRGEGASLLESVAEVIQLARESGASLHISHLKAAGRRSWRSLVPKALNIIAEARAEGLDVTFDVYPYTAGSTALYTLLPPSVQEGGIAAMLEQLREPAVRKLVAEELKTEQRSWDNLIASTGWQSVVIAGGSDPSLAGRTIAEISDERRCSPEECAISLLLEQKGNVPIVLHSMCEEDMLEILQTPGAIVVSDALYSQGEMPHPRRYGTHARLLSRYGRALGVERAVRAVTGLPAQRMGLRDRGLLEPGKAADLLLVDLNRLMDTSTYTRPVRYPLGIQWVILEGVPVLRDGGLLAQRGSLLTPID